ncbi:phage tail protein [Roseateles violae]|uniref:Tail fiber protein n=1 Tax=Roseateles violae TaxID=3058042 RepID=A0ABT8DRK0_9BURK|nr:tail fiber protein [Pelomonas sp. PFR6]MDN3920812.1 tail fiber protein [Pelomonas sp. PFR6]
MSSKHKKCVLALAGLTALPAAAGDMDYLGEFVCGAWNFAPRGTAQAAGQIMAISQNTALFSLLGTTYGGDGRTTFALPDLRGRAMLQAGQGPGLSDYALGQLGGSETHTLSVAEMPAHTHLITRLGSPADATQISPAGNVPAAKARTSYFAPASAGANMASTPSASTGQGQPFGTRQPYLAITCTIAVQGVFPARN